MSFETWVQLGVGIVLAVIAPLLNELFWRSLVTTLAGFCFAVALWQYIEGHQWHRGYFIGGCALIAVILSSFIIWSVPVQLASEKTKTVSSKSPDVGIRFVYSKSPALVLVNKSDVSARDIKWTVALWNMDLPDRNDPLPIPVSTFDWIRPHEEGGPQNLFDGPLVSPLLKPGNRLFGSAAVSCPECARGRTYIVNIVWGENGWFSEVESEKSGKILIPPNFLKASRIEYFKTLEATVPAQSRMPISDIETKPNVPKALVERPSVLLLPVPGQLQLHNRGTTNLNLWGNKLGGFPADVEKETRIIPRGAFYYFLTDKLQQAMLNTIGSDGDKLFPFEVYLSDEDGKRYIAKFNLLVKMTKGTMEVHTQQMGIRDGDWEAH
jgi:hypothetical protein